MTTPKRALTGIRVTDLCWVGAGSYATRLLADHGAEVIKIESASRPDGIRLSPPFAQGKPGLNRSGYFADRNANKLSCAINLKTERGQQICRELIQRSDVVANNFTPGVMERLGLGWERVHALNPAIVYLAMSAQGGTGPHRDHLGYGLTISAMSGLYGLTALPGRDPVGTGTNFPDHIPNPTHAAFAVLAALRHARRTGQGQLIDLSQTEATTATLGVELLSHSASEVPPEAYGNSHPDYAPHGVYACAGIDRWLAVAVTHDDQFTALAELLGLPDTVRTWNSATRQQHRSELDELISQAVTTWDRDELAHRLLESGVPAAPVQDPVDVVDHDAQLAARRHWVRLPHPEMGTTLYGSQPSRLSATPGEFRRGAPRLGEHTIEVCRDVLGMTADTVEDLIADGVLR